MSYSLATSYTGESLLSGFNWFDGRDPSNGYVAYQSRSNAEALGLFSVDEETGVVRLGVDHTNTYGLNEGRPSIRLESKAAYNEGLFIADFLHMPPSQCGLWPACKPHHLPRPEVTEQLILTKTQSGRTAPTGPTAAKSTSSKAPTRRTRTSYQHTLPTAARRAPRWRACSLASSANWTAPSGI